MNIGDTTRSNLFFRSFNLLERSETSTDERELELSFSSEEPVNRWFGKEILLHGSKNINFDRLRMVGSVLYGHQPGELKNIIGAIVKTWLDTTKRQGRAIIRFDEDESGEMALNKVKSKSLKGVSFGYAIETGRRLLEGEAWTDPDSGQNFTGPAIVATRWTPYEISLTPIPADSSVGIGREFSRSLEGIALEKSTNITSVGGFEMENGKKLVPNYVARIGALFLKMTNMIVQVKKEKGYDDDGFETSAYRQVGNDSFGGDYCFLGSMDILEREIFLLEKDGVLVNPYSSDDNQSSSRINNTSYKSMKDIPDDVFLRSLKTSDHPAPSKNLGAVKDIPDDVFARSFK